jgi:hypothetical protein
LFDSLVQLGLVGVARVAFLLARVRVSLCEEVAELACRRGVHAKVELRATFRDEQSAGDHSCERCIRVALALTVGG